MIPLPDLQLLSRSESDIRRPIFFLAVPITGRESNSFQRQVTIFAMFQRLAIHNNTQF